GPDRLRVGRWRGLCGDRSVVGAEVPGQRLQVSMDKQERFGEWTIALLQPPVDLGDADRVKAELLEGGALPEPWLGNLQHLTEAASQLREHRGVVGYLGRLGGRRRPGPFIRPDRLQRVRLLARTGRYRSGHQGLSVRDREEPVHVAVERVARQGQSAGVTVAPVG